MSRYRFQDSIRDNTTLPLHFEAVDVKLRVDQEAIDEAYREITDDLVREDGDDLAKKAARMAVLIKTPERVAEICGHIANHFREKVDRTASRLRSSPSTGSAASSTSGPWMRSSARTPQPS